jgi:hypothetical protein
MMYFGIVEDRQDPLKVGRVRVRIHQWDTDEKALLATPDLPWSHVILPTTGAGLSGLGTQHGLVEGSTVCGYFLDEEMQNFVVTGVVAGIPSNGYKKTVTDEVLERSIEKGFNDPRGLTVDAYTDKPDGPNSAEHPLRTFGLKTALDTAPKKPESLEIKYDATGSTITNPTLTEEDLPYYPLYTNESDLSKYARGLADYTPRDVSEVGGIPSVAKPVYPYNKVLETESGHVIEVDDTLDAERLAIEHRSGTFQEVHPDGSVVQRIVNDNYQIIAKNDKIYIAGDADLTVEKGNVTINVNTGNVDMKVLKGNVTSEITEGNLKADILKGTTDVLSEGKITITGNNTTEIISDTTITGTLHVTGAQTNDSTIHATGDISTSAGNSPTLATHKHKSTSQDTGSGANAGKKKDTSVPDA